MPAQDPSPSSTSTPIAAAPAFPSPQTFSILPDVHALLLRIQSSLANSANGLDQAAANPGFDSTNHQQTLLSKEISSAAASIRLKIAKAKAAVEIIPDVDRGIEEQQEEIRTLEERIKQLKTVIGSSGTNEKDNLHGKA